VVGRMQFAVHSASYRKGVMAPHTTYLLSNARKFERYTSS
jgi:hypothetical protein